jgi:hypothetical protein
MAKKTSSLMSWVNHLFASRPSDSDLIRWAKLEYGNDWQDAYYQMKTRPGKIPNVRGVTQ